MRHQRVCLKQVFFKKITINDSLKWEGIWKQVQLTTYSVVNKCEKIKLNLLLSFFSPAFLLSHRFWTQDFDLVWNIFALSKRSWTLWWAPTSHFCVRLVHQAHQLKVRSACCWTEMLETFTVNWLKDQTNKVCEGFMSHLAGSAPMKMSNWFYLKHPKHSQRWQICDLPSTKTLFPPVWATIDWSSAAGWIMTDLVLNSS